MSEQYINLEIITPERTILKESIVSLILPGERGLFGVLRNHTPLVAALTVGQVVYRKEAGGLQYRIAIAGGFFEINHNQATILADTAERTEDIDINRARKALQRAQQRRKDRQSGMDVQRAELAMQRALNRLRVAGTDIA